MITRITTALITKIGNYRRNLPKGSFGHNVLVMFLGTALGQSFAVLLAPLLTRLYSPEIFGLLGAFVSATGIMSVVAALRYEMALPLTSTSDKDGINLLAVCATSLLATTLIGFIIVALLPDTMLGALAPYKILIPIGFFCIGAYQVMIYYATREGAFKAISHTKIAQGIIGPLTQACIGLFSGNVFGLIIGFIAGQSAGIGTLFRQLVVKTPATLRLISWQHMRVMARRYIRFPLISSWAGLVNAAGTSSLLLIAIPILYSSTVGGFIFLIDRIIGRPLLLISTSILQVYVGETSKSLISNPQAVRARFLQLTKFQLVIVSVWLLLLNALAAPLFPFVFGEQWAAAVPYLHVLSIAYLPQMVVHALIHTLDILEKQALSAFWEVGRLAAILGAFATSIALGFNALEALLLYSVCQAVAQIILFGLMYRAIQSLQKA